MKGRLLAGAAVSFVMTAPFVVQAQAPAGGQPAADPAGGAIPSAVFPTSGTQNPGPPATTRLDRDNTAPENPTVARVTNPEDIVVTGYRAAQRASFDIKRSAPNIVDAITATEVGKFPDANIADSLQRITGVAIQRNNGEGQYITVRGFGPQYNNVLVNGRTMATGSNGREFDFATLSSGLISRAEIYKSYQPQLQEGGIGATVDITTARPLDAQHGFHIAAHGGGVADLLSGKTTPDLGSIATWKNENGTFGVEASVNYTQRKSYDDTARTGGWFEVAPNSNTVSIINGTPQSKGLTPAAYSYLNAGGTKSVFLPQDYQTWRSNLDSKRLTANATIQAKPTDTLLITVDGLYSKYDLDRTDRLYKSFFVQPYFSDIAFDGNGTATHFIRPGKDFFAANPLLGADPRSVPQQSDNVVNQDSATTKTYQIGGNVRWTPTDRLVVSADASQSRASFRDLGPGSVIGNYLNSNLGFDLNPDQILPTITRSGTISPSQLTNHFTWIVGNHYVDRIDEFRLSAEYKTEWGPLQSIQIGGFYSNRKKTSEYFQTYGSNYCAYCGYATPIDTSLIRPFNLGNWLSGSSGSAGTNKSFYTFNPQAVVAYQSMLSTLNSRPADEQAALSSANFLSTGGFNAVTQPGVGFDVKERVWAGYFNANLKGSFWAANIGVRVSTTHTGSSGVIQPVTSIAPNPGDSSLLVFGYGPTTNTTVKNNYTNALPTFNAKADITRNLLFRVAVSKTITRPTLSALGPSNQYAGRVMQPISSGGNPDLKPFRSWNYDASIEWYPLRDVAFSADGFHKVFSGFISNQTLIVPRAGTDINGNPTTYNFYDTRPRNGNKGTVTGAEIAGQYAFSRGPLTGFGVNANYTYVTSTQKVVTPGDCTQIEGLSKHSYNATGFYERFGIQARLSYNWRSGYLAVCRGLQGKQQNATSYGQLDGSLAYNLNQHFEIYLEAVNLTDSYLRQYSVYSNRFLLDENFGRRLLFGIRVKY